MPTSYSKDGVLAAEGESSQSVFQRACQPMEAFGKEEEKPGLQNFAAGVGQQAAGFTWRQEYRIRIDRRPRHDPPRHRVKRIVFDDAESSTWLKHSSSLCSEHGLPVAWHMVVDTNGREEIERGIIVRERVY